MVGDQCWTRTGGAVIVLRISRAEGSGLAGAGEVEGSIAGVDLSSLLYMFAASSMYINYAVRIISERSLISEYVPIYLLLRFSE